MSHFEGLNGPIGPTGLRDVPPEVEPKPLYTGINAFFAALTILLLALSPALTVIAYRAAF